MTTTFLLAIAASTACLAAQSTSAGIVRTQRPGIEPVAITPGNGTTGGFSLSDNGRYMAFEARSADFGLAVTPSTIGQIVRLDRFTGQVEAVSVADQTADALADRQSTRPSISACGQFIAFESSATNLVAMPAANGSVQVFVRDIKNRRTFMASITPNGAAGNGDSRRPDIAARPESSLDGAGTGQVFVVFDTASSDIAATPPGSRQVVRRELVADRTDLVTINVNGQSAPRGGVEARLTKGTGDSSSTGRYVVFSSSDDTLIFGDTNFSGDIFVRDMAAGVTRRVSVDSNGLEVAGSSSRGRIAYAPDLASGGDFSGICVAFDSVANRLVDNDTNASPDIFVHRITAGGGITQRVSLSTNGTQLHGQNGTPTRSICPALSADGRRVAFYSEASNVGFGATNRQVYVRDLDTDTTLFASATETGAIPDGTVGCPEISADGTVVAFDSSATNMLVSGDHNGERDLFVRVMRLAGAFEFGLSTGDPCSSPTCASRLVVTGQPNPGGVLVVRPDFVVPPSATGFAGLIVISAGRLADPLYIGNLAYWVDPFTVVLVRTPFDTASRQFRPVPVPVPDFGVRFYMQHVLLHNDGGTPNTMASNALGVTVNR